MVGEEPVQRYLRPVEQHEGEQRQHADPRDDGVKRHPPVTARASGQRSTGRQRSSGTQTANVITTWQRRTPRTAPSRTTRPPTHQPEPIEQRDQQMLLQPAGGEIERITHVSGENTRRAVAFGLRNSPCGERPTSIVWYVAGSRVEHRDLLSAAARNPQLAVGGEGDVVRAARNGVAADRRQRGRVQRRGGAADAVVHPDDLSVRREEQVDARPCRCEPADHAPSPDRPPPRSRCPCRRPAPCRRATARRRASCRPSRSTGSPTCRDRSPPDLSVPCRLTNTPRGIRRVVEMARHRRHREAFQQLHLAAS